jgi:hypothetical protein
MQRLKGLPFRISASLLLVIAGCCTPSVTGTAAPTLLTVGPVAASNTACPNAVITATFSEAMNPSSISGTTVLVTGPGGAALAGNVTYTSATNTATFTPAAILASGVTYTVTVTTGAYDLYGNKLAAPYIFSFTTAANGCHPAPAIIAFTPAAGLATACPNAVVTATFSEPMNPATINAADFTLAPGVIGTVSHNSANTIFTLTPSSSLAAGTTYTATISSAAQDTYGNPLPAYVSSFTTAANACQPPPTVIAAVPALAATGVCPNRVISANFSEAIDPTTLTAATFQLTSAGATPVTGTVSYNAAAKQAIFTPSAVLQLNTSYTATMTTGIRDLFGNNLAAPFAWSFTTGSNPCAPAPFPTSVTPANGAASICPNSLIAVTFPQAMNPLTLNATDFLVNVTGGAAVTGTVSANATNTVFTFTPTPALALSTGYTVTLTTGTQDTFGNAIASNYTSTFTTGATSCVSGGGGAPTAPTIVTVTPPLNTIGVCLNPVVIANFSAAMNPATINTNTFYLSPTVAATVALDATGKIATLTPTTLLNTSTTYIATITTGAQTTGGTPLAANFTWSFNTSAQACQPVVNLGTAANFGILASSTVTNTGATVITGENLGLSPGTSVTGFPPGIIVAPNGQNVTDATAAQAGLDAATAYNYIAGLQNAAVLPSELSGLTFTPGLYKNASSVSLTSGNVTLDAQGNSNAVFIFQIGAGLTTFGNTKILLINGAQAKNIFWQVGSSATLGVNSTFQGTLIALSSVTLNTGVNLTGRALALNAAVTLDTDIVTAP